MTHAHRRQTRRVRIHRTDWPAIIAIVILLGLMAASVARAQGPVVSAPIVETLAQKAASEAASAVAAPGWLSLAGNITVAGILAYYSRLFYQSIERKDAQILELSGRVATLAERVTTIANNYESAMRDLRNGIRHDHSATQRVTP